MSDKDTSTDEESLLDLDKNGKRKTSENCNTRKTKKRRKELLKPPTTDELNQLRETENLYSSNLIRLQIEELLAQISIKDSFIKQIELWWSDFKNLINNIKAKEEILLSDIKFQLEKEQNKRCKFINELVDNKVNLKYDKDFHIFFLPPSECFIFGEYQLKCLIKTDMSLSICIVMPPGCLNEKDYLNNRYFIKRHYYLLYILHYIKKKVTASKVTLLYNNYDCLPFIQILPEFLKKIKINVYVTASHDSFNLNRFLPNKNNIKYDFDDNFKDILAQNYSEHGTPVYNSFIARDCTLHSNYICMEGLLNVKNIQDGIKLLMLWANQRRLNKGIESFNNELLFYTIAYLLKKKKINSHMSSYQVVRIFWSFIKDSQWNKTAVNFCDDMKLNSVNTYMINYDIVFLDITGCFNITSFMSLELYLKLKEEAELAMKILDSNSPTAFSSLFLVNVPFALQYDAVVMLKSENKFNVIYENIIQAEKWKYYGFYDGLIVREISNILRKAFSKRVSKIVPYRYDTSTETTITFGINLNPEYAFNVIERGPSEDDPDGVKDFQAFWKGLTSFRRFHDSTVAEVVHFKCRTLQDKRNIFLKILNFLFTDKYPLSIRVISNQFEKVLNLDQTILHFPTGTNEEACLKVKHIYTDLNKIFRSLELPLIITNIQGISDSFSYTAVFPPVPTTYKSDQLQSHGNKFIFNMDVDTIPTHVSPIECVLQMGKSSAWSDDLTVLRCMKCEFYIRLSELLEEKYKIITFVTFDYLDVFYQGLVFRFRLFVPKELTLLKKTVDSDGIISYKDNEQSLKLERDVEVLPKVTSALNGVHQRYPSFGPCCAITKRWLRSQMIDVYHISDIVINLWVAYTYLSDAPYEVAHLPQVAFLRFLKHAIDFDWKLNPIVVNFNDDILSASLNELEVQFQQNRDLYPSMFIITPYDDGRSVFTKSNPSKHILKRITLLAKETYNFLEGIILKWDNFPVRDIFVPNLQGYDVLMYLEESTNPLRRQNLFNSDSETEKIFIEKYDEILSNKMPVVDFNPIHIYVSELREIYGEFGLFFYDVYGGSVVGILWNRQVLKPIEFKVSQVNGRKLVDDKLIVNYDAILDDIYIRGAGLVKHIERKTKF